MTPSAHLPPARQSGSRGRRSVPRGAGPRTPVENLVEVVLNGHVGGRDPSRELRELGDRVLGFDTRGTRVVVLGGGTGLSTIVGGNSQDPDWLNRPFVGLKEEFRDLHVVVCTTDDGGSTGELVKRLPMIGIGDLRKSCLSMIKLENLRQAYGVDEAGAQRILALVQCVFNHRFPAGAGFAALKDPLRVAPGALRRSCPNDLAAGFRRLGAFVSPGGGGPRIAPGRHCLGNLLLTAAVFRAGGRRCRTPDLSAIRRGLDDVARLIGAPTGCLSPATSTPGQLRFRYVNGIEVYGQSKASYARRGFPVDRVETRFAARPVVSPRVLAALRQADLIVLAPGSVYTSIMPLLQVESIAAAVRANRRALKVLAANFWVQEGETDISRRDRERGFLVSELIEAYDRNVPGGVRGLFDVVLAANLDHVPGSILRNYALEGKRPLHLDRARVERMGFQALEATLFSLQQLRQTQAIRHDSQKFALAIRTLLFARRHLQGSRWRMRAPGARNGLRGPGAAFEALLRSARSPVMSEYMASMRRAIRGKSCSPAALGDVLLQLAWDNRDIRPAHMAFFRGVRVLSRRQWDRSNEWDNVLGYFDPADRLIKVHEDLLKQPARLAEDLLIAIGESLLGRYIESRRWTPERRASPSGSRCYEIRLKAPARRECFFRDRQLRAYLKLARMVPDARDPRVFRLTMNDDEGFLPSGLLFGLLFAWYLNNAYGGAMEYEMSLLRWPRRVLMPHQVKERARKQALVRFFSGEVFGA